METSVLDDYLIFIFMHRQRALHLSKSLKVTPIANSNTVSKPGGAYTRVLSDGLRMAQLSDSLRRKLGVGEALILI